MAELVKALTQNFQTLRVRVRWSARADTCLGWDAWHHHIGSVWTLEWKGGEIKCYTIDFETAFNYYSDDEK